MPLLCDYQHDLIEGLRDPKGAAEYLNAALEDGGCDVVANALRSVIEALSLPVSAEATKALCRFNHYLGNAGLRLNVSA